MAPAALSLVWRWCACRARGVRARASCTGSGMAGRGGGPRGREGGGAGGLCRRGAAVTSTAPAFAGGVFAVLAAAECWRMLRPALTARAPRVVAAAAAVSETLAAAGREGRDPGVRERRRLLAAGAAVAFAGGAAVAGPTAGVALATAGPWLAARLLRARRERYRTG